MPARARLVRRRGRLGPVLPTARLTLADVLRGARAVARRRAVLRRRRRRASPGARPTSGSNRCANALAGDGVGRGRPGAVAGPELVPHPGAAARVLASSAPCFCPANWRQQPDELAFVIDDLEPRVDRRAGATRSARASPAAASASTARRRARAGWCTTSTGRDDSYEAFVAAGAPTDPGRRRVRRRPAAARLHRRVLRPTRTRRCSRRARSSRRVCSWRRGRASTTSSVFLNSGPLFHIGTFMPNLSTFVTGGANVFIAAATARTCAAAIADFGCTGGFVIGPMVDAIVEANADGRYDLSTFRGQARATRRSTRWCRRTARRGVATPAGTARPR